MDLNKNCFHLDTWIESVLHLLKPPVGNKLLFGKGQLKVQVVGGPNRREDFHINEGEELFYMIKGDMQLNIMECGVKREIPIKQGEIFLLNGSIPHSPQRLENTIGIVIERERAPEETDGMRWYIPGTSDTLYEDWFHCTDLGTQLKPIIEAYFASEEHKNKTTKRIFGPPPVTLDTITKPPAPRVLNEILPSLDSVESKVLYDSEFKIVVATNKTIDSEKLINEKGEVFFWQFAGTSEIQCVSNTGNTSIVHVGNGFVFLLPAGYSYKSKLSSDAVCLVITNKRVGVERDGEYY